MQENVQSLETEEETETCTLNVSVYKSCDGSMNTSTESLTNCFQKGCKSVLQCKPSQSVKRLSLKALVNQRGYIQLEIYKLHQKHWHKEKGAIRHGGKHSERRWLHLRANQYWWHLINNTNSWSDSTLKPENTRCL